MMENEDDETFRKIERKKTARGRNRERKKNIFERRGSEMLHSMKEMTDKYQT